MFCTKGLGPSTTLAWAWLEACSGSGHGTTRIETNRFKKCCGNCVLLFCRSTEFKSAFNVLTRWRSCRVILYRTLHLWVPILRGVCWQGAIVYDIDWMGCPEGNPGKCAYTCMLSYSIVVSHLGFNFLCLLLLYSIYLCGFAHLSTIAEPETELLGMPELFVELASTINLTCSIRNTHRPPTKVVS